MIRSGCATALDVERWTEALMDRLARKTRWSPIGSRLAITVDESGDAALTNVTLRGTIRACDVADDGTPTDLLVELDAEIDYAGHYSRAGIRWLVMRPCLGLRRTNRLLLTWAAARIVDAPSFRDATYSRTIATGRLRLL